MATNIPPHNLGEIIDGLIALIKDKDISDRNLFSIIKGPDFPTGGELIYSEAIKEVYKTGKGSITLRGVIKEEAINLGKGKHIRKALIISELPYQISKAGWIEKLAEIVNTGKINGITDIRDESDRDGMRIVIELKKDSNSDIIISDLYKKTSLQCNFGAIFLALINGKPIQLTLKKYLDYFLEFREETIRKRTKYFLKNTSEKLEILEGLSIATKNIKNIVETIQTSENANEAKLKLIKILRLSDIQANAILNMPLKKLTTLERSQINIDIKKLNEQKDYFNSLLNKRELLLKLLIDELILLKEKYNKKRKTKILKNINQENEIETINNQILEEMINKKTKLIIDNRFYLRKMILNNYKKIMDNENKIIDNKNLQKFICNIEKDLKIIGITFTGKVFQIDWLSNLNTDRKLDKRILNNINPNEIINFHHFSKKIKTYLCTLNSDGKFKKILFNNDMLKSNRSFTITKLKKDIKIIDSFISNGDETLIILTSIGRLFKFDLSFKSIPNCTKQSQGLLLTKLLPTEKVVSCCKSYKGGCIYLISRKGLFFSINIEEIYYSNESTLGCLHEKTKLKDDHFIKVVTDKQYIDIETNKNKSARLNFAKLNAQSHKNLMEIKLLNLEKDEYLMNCFSLEIL